MSSIDVDDKTMAVWQALPLMWCLRLRLCDKLKGWRKQLHSAVKSHYLLHAVIVAVDKI